MSIFAYLIGGILLLWALAPLFKKDSTWVSLHMEGDELEDRKQRVYGNIADLEFDYAMGRLSETDFNVIRKSFLSEAGRVIQQLENQKSSKVMELIKEDVKKLSKNPKKSKKANKHNTCAHCGNENLPEAKFCMQCGKELS